MRWAIAYPCNGCLATMRSTSIMSVPGGSPVSLGIVYLCLQHTQHRAGRQAPRWGSSEPREPEHGRLLVRAGSGELFGQKLDHAKARVSETNVYASDLAVGCLT